ncbi:MAG: hypothetical protein FWG98_06500 [Candidatus Cloacimonetes bacterium]|nr:hypothetical protein [Candidatus Cloacimonadota bacterium]
MDVFPLIKHSQTKFFSKICITTEIIIIFLFLVFSQNIFANNFFSESEASFSFLNVPEFDFSYRLVNFNTHLDYMVNYDLFLIGDLSIGRLTKLRHEDLKMYDDVLLPEYFFGFVAYNEDDFRIAGSFSRDTDLNQNNINFSLDYLLRLGVNGLLWSANYTYSNYPTIVFPDLFEIQGDDHTHDYRFSLKYRYGDRDESIRSVQHRIQPTNRSNSKNWLFFEIGSEVIINRWNNNVDRFDAQGNKIGQHTNTRITNTINHDINIDFRLNKDRFISVYSMIYSWQDDRVRWQPNENFPILWGEDVSEDILPFYSFNYMRYWEDILGIRGSFLRFDKDNINAFDFSVVYLWEINKNYNLPITLHYRREFGKDIDSLNLYGLMLKFRFGDRDKNVRNIQHR